MNEVDKAREEFLEHVHVMIDYWMNLDSEGTPQGETELKWKMEGLAFSMLVALDGGAGGLPGYEVKPLYDAYGNGYTEENPAPDIGGCLHELFHQ